MYKFVRTCTVSPEQTKYVCTYVVSVERGTDSYWVGVEGNMSLILLMDSHFLRSCKSPTAAPVSSDEEIFSWTLTIDLFTPSALICMMYDDRQTCN